MNDRALSDLARRIATKLNPDSAPLERDPEQECRRLVRPGTGYLGVREVFATATGRLERGLIDLRSLPRGRAGQRLVALRYFIDNAEIWLAHFAWRGSLDKLGADGDTDPIEEVEGLSDRVRALRERAPRLDAAALGRLVSDDSALLKSVSSPQVLEVLVALSLDADARAALRERLRHEAVELFARRPKLLDRLYLASMELSRYPATTVSAGELRYVLVADKGEMGVRAVREALALDLTPVVLHSLADDASALQVRLARDNGGLSIGLEGTFRESYASYERITVRVLEVFRERFDERWEDELARAVLYPGYGPLAENAAAIRHFRRHGIAFAGPMQDVVEHVGDKRQFRALVETIDPKTVTPGIVVENGDAALVRRRVVEAHERGDFTFPGRLKAANGGGGRGQAIVADLDALDGAISKVLGEIESNAWDPGVMFEQNLERTVHLEVQVLRDRYGRTRHFGMRDCTEQRASQKIQEEAPPALLRHHPELAAHVESVAVSIADRAGYVGAGTVELMYAQGQVYFLEMNTRIQVEHPVTEASHGIRRGQQRIEPLNLVQWQLRIAQGEPIDFEQDDVVQTHVAREFRINAESWRADLKDPRDKQRGMFVPNGGVFDRIELPDPEEILLQLADRGAEDVKIRFDVGFDEGDVLINKDPTFGKLIVAARAADEDDAYELLRVVSLAVLERVRIEGRQARPDGRILDDSTFLTNLETHRELLEHPILRRHAGGEIVEERHVGWVVDALRAQMQ